MQLSITLTFPEKGNTPQQIKASFEAASTLAVIHLERNGGTMAIDETVELFSDTVTAELFRVE